MSEDGEFCATCGASVQITWCPAWQVWLCHAHQFERSYRELDATQRPAGWLEAQARDVAVTLR